MATDDSMMYPQDGSSYDTTYAPGIPAERKEEESKEAAVIAASYPIIEKNAQWFHDAAMNSMDISNIDVNSKVPVESQVIAFQHLQNLLIAKAREYQDYMGEQ
jgi:hypothetical protein